MCRFVRELAMLAWLDTLAWLETAIIRRPLIGSPIGVLEGIYISFAPSPQACSAQSTSVQRPVHKRAAPIPQAVHIVQIFSCRSCARNAQACSGHWHRLGTASALPRHRLGTASPPPQHRRQKHEKLKKCVRPYCSLRLA